MSMQGINRFGASATIPACSRWPQFGIQESRASRQSATGSAEADSFQQAPLKRSKLDERILKLSKPFNMPETNAMLTRKATQLMKANGMHVPVKVFVVDKPYVVNNRGGFARALSNGSILVSRDFLKHAKTPEELTFMLAREIAHLEHKTPERLQRSMSKMIWLPVAAFMGSSLLVPRFFKDCLRDGLATMGATSLLSFGAWAVMARGLSKRLRDNESYADQRAVVLLTQAGYSSSGYKQLMRAVQADENKNGRALTVFRAAFGQVREPAAQRKAMLDPLVQMAPDLSDAPPLISKEEWQAFKQASASLNQS